MALLTGGGAALVAFLMIGSATASVASASLTVSPAYHGLALSTNGFSQSGCNSKATISKHWKFHMFTGIASGAQSGKASGCGAKTIKGLTVYSTASANGGFEAIIKLPAVPASTSNISANLAGKVTTTITATDGGATAVCNSGLYSYSYSDTFWEWGYTGSYFTGYAYNDSTNSNGVWYNYSYNTASIPSPFNLNNTTYYDHSQGAYTYGSCSASASIDMGWSAQIYDRNTQTYQYASGQNVPSYSYMSDSVYASTDYGYYNDTYWYGPSNYSSVTGLVTYSYNTSLTSSTFMYSYPPYSYSSSTGNSSTLTNTTVWSLTGAALWFTGSWSTTDHYYLVLNMFVSNYASVSNWAHGSGSFSTNAATSGNGAKLSSITMS